ncbi:MAG: hypC [Planctomycetaceae bacterium]|nr:hypC [Planctomycetaceae bacterium]
MCLAVPGKIVRWIERGSTFARAEVEFGGVRRICHMACVPDAPEGDYVLVHAGVAITRLDSAEALRVLQDLATLDAVEDQDEVPPL